MLYDEQFFPINQAQNNFLTIRQAGCLNADKSYHIERNNSKTNVIAFVESGYLHVKTEEKKIAVGPNQSLFLPNSIKYSIYADKKNPPVMYWLNIRGIVFDSIIASFKLDTMLCECKIIDLFNNIVSLAKEFDNNFNNISENVFSLLLRLRDSRITASSEENENSEENIYEAYICNHIQSNFSVKKMAKDLHVSADVINRIFTKNYGITPYQYYQNMRIDFAKHLLSKSELTIEDIAKRLNFTDRNYFSLYFKKKIGSSPAAFRKSARN